ncbi:nuclear transport factor 2 family protein [Geojedonia litorea]|uniref:Nuclear transport factor 2 family protein n=1 Tax=Geojedonia litorea TaxID=1268269 RepID=A0ABV9N1X4_9FLAO
MKQFKHRLILALLVTLSITIQAQEDGNSQVFNTLKVNDSLLFDLGFNTCDLSQFKALITDDLEFYHDKSGILNSKQAFIDVMANGICSATNPYRARRELIEGSLKVYSLYNNGKLYGAIQEGSHRFYERFEGKETPGSIAKFTHLWIIDKDQWKLKRVLSYDHQL